MDDHTGPPVTGNTPLPANPPPESSLSVGALILIVVGAVLFLDNLGIIPFANIRAYWPLAISAWGVVCLSRARSACSMVWPWVMIVAGVLLTLGNLGFLHVTFNSLWPLLLIAAGVGMLLARNSWGPPSKWEHRPWEHRPFQFGHPNEWGGPSSHFFGPGERIRRKFFGNIIHENAVFSSVNRRIDTANFEGADLNSTFGELKVDLRGATITPPNREVIVQTNASFGAIKLRVPETWRVLVHGSAVFGSYEDKTVPPRPVPGIDTPTLIIRGNAAFGAVEIEN